MTRYKVFTVLGDDLYSWIFTMLYARGIWNLAPLNRVMPHLKLFAFSDRSSAVRATRGYHGEFLEIWEVETKKEISLFGNEGGFPPGTIMAEEIRPLKKFVGVSDIMRMHD